MARSQVDKQQKQTLSAPYIETLTNANDELLGMKFSYNIHGKRIAVMVSYDAPTQYDQRDTSVPGKYLHRYEEAGWRSDGAKTSDNAEKRLNAITEEIQRLVDDTCYKILMEIAGPPPTALLPRTKVESNEGVLVSQEGELKGVRLDDIPPPTRWPTHSDIAALEYNAKIKVPVYTPSHFQLQKSFLFHPWVLLVSNPNGDVLCCKLSASHAGFFKREYDALRKMHDVGCKTETLHVPHVKGPTRTATGYGEEGIVGILMDYIDTEKYELTFHLAPPLPSSSLNERGEDINYRKDGEEDNTHTCTDLIPEIASSRRGEWLSQIQSTIYQLHALGIVWGDAKTVNLFLDKNDDLWVIDFGGGGTPGWIDKRLIYTKEGRCKSDIYEPFG